MVRPPSWIESSTVHDVVGVISPASSAAAKVTTLLTEPGSNGELTAMLDWAPSADARLVGVHRVDLAGLDVLDDRHAAFGADLVDVVLQHLGDAVLQVGVQGQRQIRPVTTVFSSRTLPGMTPPL